MFGAERGGCVGLEVMCGVQGGVWGWGRFIGPWGGGHMGPRVMCGAGSYVWGPGVTCGAGLSRRPAW